MTELEKLDAQYIAHTYGRFPIDMEKGKGSMITDTQGKEYIDMGTGIAVSSFGIGDEEWKNAVIGQINKIPHTSNLYFSEPCVKLAKLLCEKTGMSKVFFGNSGAEANECSIKVARKYAAEKKGPEYTTIVTLVNSFHGRTLTTLSATGQDHYHELFNPLTPGFVHTPAEDLEALKKTVAENKVAGILIECVQGEGGVIALSREFVKGIEEICRKDDIIFMVDEVQTGNGRSGSLYSYMNYGVHPDVVSTAKGLGGGLPIGACLMSDKVKDVLGPGDHGSTFGANPVCCAGACSIIGRIDQKLLDGVKERSEFLFDTFKDAPGIEAVTGMGLMIGLKTTKPAGEVVKACLEKGVICLTAKDKVRLLPALNIPMDLLKKASEVIKEVAKAD